MKWYIEPRMRCPSCNLTVPGIHQWGGPLECAQCHAKLQISQRRIRAKFAIVLAASAAIPALLGYRGWSLAIAAVAGNIAITEFRRIHCHLGVSRCV